jgi:hypothetical protein
MKVMGLLILIFLTNLSFATRVTHFENLAEKTYRKYPNTLTFHVTNSPTDLNWEGGPRDLLWSLIKNKYFYKDRTKRAMGHVTVELNCNDKKNKIRRIGGQGAKDLSQFTKHLLGGAGFNVILSPDHKQKYNALSSLPFYNIDGRFETPKELFEEYDQYLKTEGLFNLVTFTVTPDTCFKLVEYFDEYEKVTKATENSPQKKAANVYGNGADPLKFEGAGCAPFAVAFLKKANLNERISLLTDRVYVGKELFSSQKENVSIFSLLTTSHQLKEKTKNSFELEFPSPSKLYHAVNQIYKKGEVIEKGFFGSSAIKYVVLDGKKD